MQRQPEGVIRTPRQSIEQAQQLLDSGLPFQAHEVFEDAWKSADGPARDLWKGLAQIAVGLTHLSRGNLRGAKTLLLRGTRAVAAFDDDRPYGLDIPGILRWSAALTAKVEAAQEVAQVSWSAPVLCPDGAPQTVDSPGQPA